VNGERKGKKPKLHYVESFMKTVAANVHDNFSSLLKAFSRIERINRVEDDRELLRQNCGLSKS
jgi:hypothetical protein